MKIFRLLFFVTCTILYQFLLGQSKDPLGLTRDELIAQNPAWDFIVFEPNMIVVSPKEGIQEVYFFDTEAGNMCYAFGMSFPEEYKDKFIESFF